MHSIDWIVLLLTLFGIVIYGIWKTRGSKNLEDYLAGSRSTPWWAIGLSIMATQASAITFISTPGLGYDSGLRFAQFYYGLPIAMVIIALFFAPRYFHLKVFTAYEFLEKRFNRNTRLFTAFLFLVQRGLAAGITIYAPSIILSEILGWNLQFNIWFIGILVILYTVSGGTKAVTQTHKQQMTVIFIGLFVAFGYLLYYIQEKTTITAVLDMAGKRDMLNALDFKFNLEDRYNVWSGLIGGTFLMLSYFGTDQSQVQRYLSGKSLKNIRTGLYFNAILKIPLQIFILFIGVLVFSFYTVYEKPLSFNNAKMEWLKQNESSYYETFAARQEHINRKKEKASLSPADLESIRFEQDLLDKKVEGLVKEREFSTKVKDTDYVFISWVLRWLPVGLVGLLLAVIFSAAMSSTAAELNALATTTVVDFYKPLGPEFKDKKSEVRWSKLFTLFWGIIAIIFASLASLFENNLVEFVNILGSLFYGTILGVFLVALFIKWIGAKAVLIGATIAQLFIFLVYFAKDEINEMFAFEISFLWYNFIACMIVLLVAALAQSFLGKEPKEQS
ncbi:sodium:solute symporter [bacterium]|nr:sodium:solute symporter [bacterium]